MGARCCRPSDGPAPPLGLLLLLLSALAAGCASLRLLDHPAPVCSQEGLNCTVKNSTCLDDTWIHPRNLTPSSPKNVQVQIRLTHMKHGDLVPVVHIKWTLQTDASILFLEGAELSILQLDTNERLCVEFKFLTKLNHFKRWYFTFDHFVVDPGQEYEVTVHHLPKPIPDGDPNHLSRNVLVPDCKDPEMKMTTLCLSSGSLWDPNITVDKCEAEQLRVSFTLWNESTHYQILLSSFPHVENLSCFESVLQIPAPGEENFHQRTNVTFPIPHSDWCCRHQVQVQPFFSTCLNDCLRYSVTVSCPKVPPTPDFIADHIPLWGYIFITGVSILLVGSVILMTLCLTWRLPGSHREKSDDGTKGTDVLPAAALSPPPLKPRKVWIVYSADHPLYVDVVLKFAQFLLTTCGTEVALDLLEEQVISEAKWQAILGWEEAAVQLRCDHQKPTGDLFTAAMNMILPDFKKPASFGTYVICYFTGISSEDDIPDLFNITPRYPLMDKFEEVYFRIQDLEMFEPGQMCRVRELAEDSYLQSPSGRQLRGAVERFQQWQIQCPDWFERESLRSTHDQDLSSLDEEVFEDPLLPPGERIVRQKPLVREPAPKGCQLVDVCLREEGRGPSKLQLQPLGELEAGALRALVLPVEQVPVAHAVKPAQRVVGSSTANRLVVVEGEACPLLGGSSPRRNSVLFLPVDPEDSPLCSTPVASPEHLGDGREQLEGLMFSLLQQSLSSRAHEGWEEAIAVLKDPCTHYEEEQRQSVQSDQGYISRSSPQPPDGPVEMEEEEEEDQDLRKTGEQLSPEDLQTLRSLQQQLFFQELQKNSGWDSRGSERPTAGGQSPS